jgi:hypothetical protein
MKTIWRIPYERAPVDPSWLVKAHAGRKLDNLESEEWYRHIHDKGH